ncbi:3-dehydroquinate synthase, partial [Mobiluncus curtisii]|nr:3-dehydroquinate synthase [Mobiluncus curtisii]
VSADLYESGQREHLNYGHTLAHAIERVEDYRFPHGLAVSIGMVFAANLATVLGLGSKDLSARLREQLEAVGLPTTYTDHTFAELLPVMFSDKKVRGGQLRFVLLEDWGKPVVVPVADSQALVKAAELT